MTEVVYANRVHEACSGSGESSLELIGALSGKATFTSKIATGKVVPYVLLDGNGVDWEVGFGTLASATELQRTTVKDSSATSGRVNSETAGSPVKISLTTNQHEVFVAPFDKTVFSRDTDGALSNPSAIRAALFVDTIDDMTALAGLEDEETVIVLGGATLNDGMGGVFRWDASDAGSESPPESYEHDSVATGLFKRQRINVQGLFNGLAEVDAAAADTATTGGGAFKLFFRKKATDATAWARLFADYVSSTVGRVRLGIRYAQASTEKFFADFYTTGDNFDRIELLEPVVLPARTNANGLKARALSYLSGVSQLVMARADAAATGSAADYFEIPLTKGHVRVVAETLTQLKGHDAAALFQNGDKALVLGINALGDCQAFYVHWSAASSATANDYSVLRPSTGAASSGDGRWLRLNAQGNIDAAWFGLAPSRTAAQNKTALVAAFAYATTLQESAQGMDWNRRSPGITVPDGEYAIDGNIDAPDNLVIEAETVYGVDFNITSGQVLFVTPNALRNVHVSGFNFNGGEGVLLAEQTATTVQGFRVFEDCRFDGYTGFAVANASDDEPNWKFNRCYFSGAVAGGTIGVALGGYVDGVSFNDCEFFRNAYHAKIGDRIGGSVYFRNCTFLQFTGSIKEADCWIVPNNTDAFGVNSGDGFIFDACKFGNENDVITKPKILIADEDSGSGDHRGERTPSTTFNTTGFVSRLIFGNCRIVTGGAGASAPFIKSYFQNVPGVSWQRSNRLHAQFTYLCEFAETPAEVSSYILAWDIEIGATWALLRPFTLGISNKALGSFNDHHGLASDDDAVIWNAQTGLADTEYKLLCESNGDADVTVAGSATKTTTPDRNGPSRASEVTAASASNSGVYRVFDFVAVTSLTRASNVTTAVTTTPHGLQVGDVAPITNATESDFNGKHTVTAVTDQFTFTYANTGSNGTATGSPRLYPIRDNQLGWVQIELAAGLTRSVNELEVSLINTSSGAVAKRWRLRPTTRWKSYVLDFVLPATVAADTAAWIVQISAIDYSSGVRDRFRVGHFKVHLGRQPIATRAAFSAHKNGTGQTSIATGTPTKLTFTTERFDKGGFYDASNSKWVPPKGMVRISACAVANNTLTTDTSLVVSLYKNGVLHERDQRTVANVFGNAGGTWVDEASGFDEYEVYITGTAASTFDVSGEAYNTYFAGEAIG